MLSKATGHVWCSARIYTRPIGICVGLQRLSQCITITVLSLFDDESDMFIIISKNPNGLVMKMNTEIVKVVDWFKQSLKKIHFIIFRKRRRNLFCKLRYQSIM